MREATVPGIALRLDGPTSTRNPGRTEEAGGVVCFGDSVVLQVGPREVTHGDFVIRGRFTGDPAHGVWAGPMPADGSGPSGRSVMRRLR